jgi:hypothetical protein
MPHQILEEIPVKAGPKPWLEPHIQQGMSEDANNEQKYLRAKERLSKLSFDTYYRHRSLFDDEDIQATLPSRNVVRKYLDNDNLLVYESLYKWSQEAPFKQRLYELIERGPVDEGAEYIVARYLGCYLASISSDAARQVFSSSNLYEEAIRPLLARYPEIVREATIQLAAVLIEQISNELQEDKDDMLLLSSMYSDDCPRLRCLIADPKLSQLLPADQIEAVEKTLEEAAKLYNDDPDLYDYLDAAYDVLGMLDRQ